MSIGIFDSGLGGVTVLREIRKIFKNEDIVYYADTARLPYGDKSKDEIIEFSRQIVKFLLDKKVELILIACNTATSAALDILKSEFDVEIIGVINSGVQRAIKNNESIGIIATNATVRSNKYAEKIKEANENLPVYQIACPKLVPAIEEGIISGNRLDILLEETVGKIEKDISTLILGCTHYSIIKDEIKEKYPRLNIVDPSYEMANKVNLDDKGNGSTVYYVSGDVEKFRSNIKNVFNIQNADIRGV